MLRIACDAYELRPEDEGVTASGVLRPSALLRISPPLRIAKGVGMMFPQVVNPGDSNPDMLAA